MERYKELKELARKRGAVLNQSAEKLHWEIKADREKLQFDLRRKSEIQVGFCVRFFFCLFFCNIVMYSNSVYLSLIFELGLEKTFF